MELANLQSLIQKDARSYRDDFVLQYEHFQAELAIFSLDPAGGHKKFSNLVNFLSSVAHHYKKEECVKVRPFFS